MLTSSPSIGGPLSLSGRERLAASAVSLQDLRISEQVQIVSRFDEVKK
jgi:hypothetical protein